MGPTDVEGRCNYIKGCIRRNYVNLISKEIPEVIADENIDWWETLENHFGTDGGIGHLINAENHPVYLSAIVRGLQKAKERKKNELIGDKRYRDRDLRHIVVDCSLANDATEVLQFIWDSLVDMERTNGHSHPSSPDYSTKKVDGKKWETFGIVKTAENPASLIKQFRDTATSLDIDIVLILWQAHHLINMKVKGRTDKNCNDENRPSPLLYLLLDSLHENDENKPNQEMRSSPSKSALIIMAVSSVADIRGLLPQKIKSRLSLTTLRIKPYIHRDICLQWLGKLLKLESKNDDLAFLERWNEIVELLINDKDDASYYEDPELCLIDVMNCLSGILSDCQRLKNSNAEFNGIVYRIKQNMNQKFGFSPIENVCEWIYKEADDLRVLSTDITVSQTNKTPRKVKKPRTTTSSPGPDESSLHTPQQHQTTPATIPYTPNTYFTSTNNRRIEPVTTKSLLKISHLNNARLEHRLCLWSRLHTCEHCVLIGWMLSSYDNNPSTTFFDILWKIIEGSKAACKYNILSQFSSPVLQVAFLILLHRGVLRFALHGMQMTDDTLLQKRKQFADSDEGFRKFTQELGDTRVVHCMPIHFPGHQFYQYFIQAIRLPDELVQLIKSRRERGMVSSSYTATPLL